MPLRHFDYSDISNIRLFQNPAKRLNVVFFRHKRREPQALACEINTLFDHGCDELYLATGTPKFRVLPPKVELLGTSFAKIAPLTRRAFVRLFDGCMERWVAHGDVKRIARFNHASKDVFGHMLSSQRDVQRVGNADVLCGLERACVYIDPREMPAIFALTNKRVHHALLDKKRDQDG